ncbi:hypothetical protein GN244_ATG00068 [Phytophthora infestans]|uniref:Uncharacterized protein n=1 Tax=Phytophthora infestans TaxID=4787 RepID=A0A833THT8_PHYIN|nr:hypothetical protein GN244_ATG00068 [Phytophthora infestans]
MARTMQVDKMSGGVKSSGQQQVKVSAKTSTEQLEQAEAETWPVAYLSDRKDTAKGTKYQVVWRKPDG